MTRPIIAAAAAVLFVAPGFIAAPSYAQDGNEMTGLIRHIDAEEGRILLSTGDFFNLGDGVDASSLAVGQRVSITYEGEVDQGELTATAIEPATAG